MRRAVTLLALLVLAGCGASDKNDSDTVVAAFYPLAWAAEQIVAEGTEVVNLTPHGAEPHDVELSPRDAETIREARVVLYAGGGFQPAVEDVVSERSGISLDVLPGGGDPHVWLDPVRFAQVVMEIGQALGRAEHAREVAGELTQLDVSYRHRLERCERRTLVTSHAAFSQLADRYGLTQLSLTGISPEAEPGPRVLEQLIDDVRASGATTVFAEPLVSDRVAQTVAREAGADVAVLDPLEGLSDDRLAAGEDYLSVMRTNLAVLREALGCR
ncbi:MAG: metal ABC transporter substrate-binding protein [Actinomycetota bacterium]|nr:metal ABC transporter substrate-binding protein [Actinomycetota bacterium]